MPADTGDKTEDPTPRRLQEAREQGQIARSMDLSAAAGLLAGLVMLNIYGKAMVRGLMDLLQQCLTLDDVHLDGLGALKELYPIVLSHLWMILGPVFLVLVVVAVVVNLAQVGFLFISKPLTPNLNKLSPLSGLQRLFSMRSSVRLVMSLFKVIIIGAVAFVSIKGFIPELIGLSGLAFTEVITHSGQMIFLLGLRMALVLFLLAVADYSYQRFQMMRDLRMSKEEVKEEMKRMEGDPTMRQRRRAVARQLANQRMSQAVPKADVVVTNPTELAIALKYDPENMAAPKVVAKGAGYMARRIREIALDNNVPILERKPLARALFKACEVGDFVPPELYKAVAEVLAYVFQLAGKGFNRSVAS